MWKQNINQFMFTFQEEISSTNNFFRFSKRGEPWHNREVDVLWLVVMDSSCGNSFSAYVGEH